MRRVWRKGQGDCPTRYVRWWMECWNAQVKKVVVIDVKPAEGAMAFALLPEKTFPQIMTVSAWWFVAVLVLCCVRLWYVVLIK